MLTTHSQHAFSPTRKEIWQTAYMHALTTRDPCDAEAQADDAVRRYEAKWKRPSILDGIAERNALADADA
ncbi:MAG: hypothetical protein AAGC76_13825 [Luteibacter sp.]|uniref:hypothetical protein n=1 Tax=Luteibacter sp. TaxID=1886636 RepID=UPI0028080835|nr:hypothetical protein [Luteibacter sp.]MDQ7996912.1 hypothetical protein [Luteibacter sp.]MDQ8049284.1 hypothetical protein [Luteibacter sp.]